MQCTQCYSYNVHIHEVVGDMMRPFELSVPHSMPWSNSIHHMTFMHTEPVHMHARQATSQGTGGIGYASKGLRSHATVR